MKKLSAPVVKENIRKIDLFESPLFLLLFASSPSPCPGRAARARASAGAQRTRCTNPGATATRRASRTSWPPALDGRRRRRTRRHCSLLAFSSSPLGPRRPPRRCGSGGLALPRWRTETKERKGEEQGRRRGRRLPRPSAFLFPLQSMFFFCERVEGESFFFLPLFFFSSTPSDQNSHLSRLNSPRARACSDQTRATMVRPACVRSSDSLCCRERATRERKGAPRWRGEEAKRRGKPPLASLCLWLPLALRRLLSPTLSCPAWLLGRDSHEHPRVATGGMSSRETPPWRGVIEARGEASRRRRPAAAASFGRRIRLVGSSSSALPFSPASALAHELSRPPQIGTGAPSWPASDADRRRARTLQRALSQSLGLLFVNRRRLFSHLHLSLSRPLLPSTPTGYRPRSRRAQQDQAPHGAQVGQCVPEAAGQGEKKENFAPESRSRVKGSKLPPPRCFFIAPPRPPLSLTRPPLLPLLLQKKNSKHQHQNSSTSSSRAAPTPSSTPSSSAASTCRRPTARRSRSPSSPSS